MPRDLSRIDNGSIRLFYLYEAKTAAPRLIGSAGAPPPAAILLLTKTGKRSIILN